MASNSIAAYTQDREAVKEYYANLLILQYRGKPKARETIKISADLYLADGLIFQLQDILDIDTAEGAQLDLIGKILGCSRTVQGLIIDKKYFSFAFDDDTPAYGFSTLNELSEGLFKTLENSDLSFYSLPDDAYRTLLKFVAIANMQYAGWGSMDENLYNVFKDAVVLANNQNLSITYIIAEDNALAARAALAAGFLRAPIGIGYGYIMVAPDPTKIFSYSNKYGTFGYGYSTKDKLSEGTWLTKDNILAFAPAATMNIEV